MTASGVRALLIAGAFLGASAGAQATNTLAPMKYLSLDTSA
jgi:hypothetical protein